MDYLDTCGNYETSKSDRASESIIDTSIDWLEARGT